MKKYNLLKAIGIVFLFVIVLTWFIPIGSYSNGAFTLGDTAPVITIWSYFYTYRRTLWSS